MSKAVRLVGVVLAAVMVLAACGGDSDKKVRDYISDRYERVSGSGTYVTYRSNSSVDSVGDAIGDAVEPGRDYTDTTGRYLGYEDTMVHVERSTTGDTRIEVTDARDGYDRWGPVITPVWGTFGGSYRSGFANGGSGSGK